MNQRETGQSNPGRLRTRVIGRHRVVPIEKDPWTSWLRARRPMTLAAALTAATGITLLGTGTANADDPATPPSAIVRPAPSLSDELGLPGVDGAADPALAPAPAAPAAPPSPNTVQVRGTISTWWGGTLQVSLDPVNHLLSIGGGPVLTTTPKAEVGVTTGAKLPKNGPTASAQIGIGDNAVGVSVGPDGSLSGYTDRTAKIPGLGPVRSSVKNSSGEDGVTTSEQNKINLAPSVKSVLPDAKASAEWNFTFGSNLSEELFLNSVLGLPDSPEQAAARARNIQQGIFGGWLGIKGAPSDAEITPAPVDTTPPAPTPVDTTPALAPVDTDPGLTPTEDPGTVPVETPPTTPVDTTPPALTPVDTTPPALTPVDTAPPALTPVDTAPPALTPVDTAPPALTPVDTTPPALTPVDTTPPALTPVTDPGVTPVDTDPGVTPVDTAPPTTTPVDTAPPATTPVDTAPPATAPVDTAPPATAPVDTAPPATAPVDTDPGVTPVDTAPPATAPVDTTPQIPAGTDITGPHDVGIIPLGSTPASYGVDPSTPGAMTPSDGPGGHVEVGTATDPQAGTGSVEPATDTGSGSGAAGAGSTDTGSVGAPTGAGDAGSSGGVDSGPADTGIDTGIDNGPADTGIDSGSTDSGPADTGSSVDTGSSGGMDSGAGMDSGGGMSGGEGGGAGGE